MTYTYCKKVIDNRTYANKESMQLMLDVFLLNSRITQEQYGELTALLTAQP